MDSGSSEQARSVARRLAEAKADAILAEIPDADFAALADAAVGVLLSAARARAARVTDTVRTETRRTRGADVA